MTATRRVAAGDQPGSRDALARTRRRPDDRRRDPGPRRAPRPPHRAEGAEFAQASRRRCASRGRWRCGCRMTIAPAPPPHPIAIALRNGESSHAQRPPTPEGEHTLSNAERQARYRARREADQPAPVRPLSAASRPALPLAALERRWSPGCSPCKPNTPPGTTPCRTGSATPPRPRPCGPSPNST